MIVTALVAGAAAGGQETVSQGVKDAYTGLKAALTRRFARRAPAETALAEVESHAGGSGDAGPWQKVLEGEIVETGARDDQDVLALAQRLLELVGTAGDGRYQVDASGAQGVQVGDHNTQTNTFGPR